MTVLWQYFRALLRDHTIFILLAFAAVARLAMIIFFQTEGGDTLVYLTLAENILRGCGLSHSDPSSSECILAAGGYFPGYPAFIALTWLVFGRSVYLVLLAQLVCYLLALYWLLVAVMRLTSSRRVMFFTGMALALSPLQVGWYRFVLTEPLAIATSIWVLAEIVISVADRKFRFIYLSIALSASIYVRPDSVLMFACVCLLSFFIYDFKKAILNNFVVILLVAIPVSAWITRNISHHQSPLIIAADFSPQAPGYFRWLETWITNEYERADTNFPVWRAEYSKIELHRSRYINDDEGHAALLLVKELSAFDGYKVPPEIDQEFDKLASLKIQRRSPCIAIVIFFERIFWLLFNPTSSWGLPIELKGIDRTALKRAMEKSDLNEVFDLLDEHKTKIFGKVLTFGYRLAIFVGFTFILVRSFCAGDVKSPGLFSWAVNVLIAGTAAFLVSRLVFFAYIGGLESRYLVEFVPWIEFCIILFLLGRRQYPGENPQRKPS